MPRRRLPLAIALPLCGPRMRLVLAPWAVCLVATAGLVWGGAGWWAGALAAALTALVAWGVVRLAGRSSQRTAPQHLPE